MFTGLFPLGMTFSIYLVLSLFNIFCPQQEGFTPRRTPLLVFVTFSETFG